jgi:ParB/RepB/Spo0J family partition protein
MPGVKELAVGRRDMFLVPLDSLLVVEGRNPRQDFGDLDQLAADIAQNGQQTAIICNLAEDQEHLEICDGERRYRALLKAVKGGAEIKGVLVRMEERGTSEQDRLVKSISSNNGKPLTPIELSNACKKMQGWGWTAQQIAQRLGYSRTHINSLLDLGSASPEIAKAVESHKISVSAATKLSKAPQASQRAILDRADAGERVKYREVQAARGRLSTLSMKGIKTALEKVEGWKTNHGPANCKIIDAVGYGLRVAAGLEALTESAISKLM